MTDSGMEDIYKQNKAEMIAVRLHADPALVLSRAIEFKGRLDGVLNVVRQLQHHCGFPERSYQVKFNGDREVLRLSDYHTRHVVEPGGHFWMLDNIIMGGSLGEHAQVNLILAFAAGGPEPDEDDMTAQLYAIVTALKALRAVK